jgi:hypothetical protein
MMMMLVGRRIEKRSSVFFFLVFGKIESRADSRDTDVAEGNNARKKKQ